MNKQRLPLGDRIYRNLLRILPFDFRSEFGSEMEEVFREQRTETQEQEGSTGLWKMWWATITDIFRMAPREHWSVLSQDARYALRMMKKNFGFTLAAILILGLGIGANSAIFSIVNSVLFKPLPYTDGDRLITLHQPETKLGTQDAGFSVGEITDYRQMSRSIDHIVEYHNMTFTLYGKGAAYRVRTGVVSAEFFDVFGVQPLMGRTFVKSDDQAGADPVLLLSYEFWRQIEHSDPNIVGKHYEMNDRIHTVIGVLPPIPQYPDENDVYMPTTSCPMRSNAEMMAPRTHRMMNVFARLKSGETLEHSRADIARITQEFHKDHSKDYPQDSGIETTLSLLRDDLTSRARPFLLLLWGAAAFVLVISCANVANLIMARMTRREHELMVRAAVGAGSGRLLRQLLTESFFLALLASGFGLLFALGSVQLMKDFAEQITPRAREIAIDKGVLAFTILCASATTIIFGSVAAIYSRQNLASGLKEGGRTGPEKESIFLRKFLIMAQVAFSCILLVGAGLMVRSFVQLMRVNPGFIPERVLAVRLNLNGTRFEADEKRLQLAKRIEQKLASIPGVAAAAISSSFPLDEDNQYGGRPIRFQVEGNLRPVNELAPVTTFRSASPDYFRTLGITLLQGRTFRESDGPKDPIVVVLNQVFAKKTFGNTDPIGKRLIAVDMQNITATVIGVVGDVKEFGLNLETPYQIYIPLAQSPNLGSALVRTNLKPDAMAEQIRRAVNQVEPFMAVVRVETMEQARMKSVASPRTLMHLFSLFAILAFIISIAGIGSMLALWVRERTRETGIRMALGASPKNILSSVIGQGMTLTVAGVLIGLCAALLVTRLLTMMLFQVKSTDPATYALISILLFFAALIACYVPARRAAKIDPQIALRCE
jgi:putative ABC transport system permease protein